MKKKVGVLITLILILWFCPQFGQADIVYIKNGDKLFGTVQNPSFTLQTPYGKIIIKNEYLKSLAFENLSAGRWIVNTVNNDRFSGSWADFSVKFIQENGETKEFNKEDIQRIKREIQWASYPVTTTIFTMKNNDRFSGKFLNPSIKIRANYLTKSVQSNDINRIDFIKDDRIDTKILLINGDLIAGKLEPNQIRMAPDTISEFSIAQSGLKTIQFNAPKMVLKNFNQSDRFDRDSDGDGIPDYADICMDTPRGVRVNQDGCSSGLKIASLNNHMRDTTPADLENILFDFDRSEIKPQYYTVLDDVAIMLSQNPEAKMEIQGHTDNIGSAEYNQNLSEKRARTVRNYFVLKGVDEDRLLPVGYGFTAGRVSNEDEAGRAQNRRVEFSLQN